MKNLLAPLLATLFLTTEAYANEKLKLREAFKRAPVTPSLNQLREGDKWYCSSDAQYASLNRLTLHQLKNLVVSTKGQPTFVFNANDSSGRTVINSADSDSPAFRRSTKGYRSLFVTSHTETQGSWPASTESVVLDHFYQTLRVTNEGVLIIESSSTAAFPVMATEYKQEFSSPTGRYDHHFERDSIALPGIARATDYSACISHVQILKAFKKAGILNAKAESILVRAVDDETLRLREKAKKEQEEYERNIYYQQP